jgi:small subunit ribosomal protein S27Ae
MSEKKKEKEETVLPTPPKEEKPAEKKKKEKKKRKEKKVYSLYKIEKDKVSRLLPFCERCGQGYFMADHGNRYTCGHCGFTRYKQTAVSS